MVDKIFWNDPYCVRVDTRVARVVGQRVWLEETNFFAFSGGQESDTGSIAGRAVLAAEKDGLDIGYSLPETHGLQPGDRVEVRIDWERRYRLMRLHFAAEMVLQLVYRQRPGIARIGSHIAADKARIDFASNENISALFGVIAHSVDGLVAADSPIITDYTDRLLERRYWEVAGFARMSCGGTHPRTTGEVGRVALKRRNIGKDKERIEILLDSELPQLCRK